MSASGPTIASVDGCSACGESSEYEQQRIEKEAGIRPTPRSLTVSSSTRSDCAGLTDPMAVERLATAGRA